MSGGSASLHQTKMLAAAAVYVNDYRFSAITARWLIQMYVQPNVVRPMTIAHCAQPGRSNRIPFAINRAMPPERNKTASPIIADTHPVVQSPRGRGISFFGAVLSCFGDS